MIGVRFNRAMRPYGAGDTALLPEAVAQTVVDEGSAELYEFPASPYATGTVAEGSPVVDGSATALAVRPKQTYRTKGK